MEKTSLKARWEKHNKDRQGVLQRGRDCSELTLPYILPPEGHTEDSKLPTPDNSIGARGVTNLASKLLLALLPPNAPFFRMAVDELFIKQQKANLSEVQAAFSKVERAIHMELEGLAVRVQLFEALKHLITVGNILLYLPPKEQMQVYKLDQYCVKRDPMGHILEILIKEEVSPDVLDPEIRELIEQTKDEKKDDNKKDVELYTIVERDGQKWTSYQEAGGVTIEKSRSTYPLKKCPYRVLRWSHVANEDYGRGLVEEYIGDLRTLKGLSKAINEGSAASAKVIFLVNPNGVTRVKKIAGTANGGFCEGRAADIEALQVQKQADLAVAERRVTSLEHRLSQAFMLNASVQRDAERVTAQEIRIMASELEDTLGGVYSLLSQDLQLWLVETMINRMVKARTLPSIDKKLFKPIITTGLEALGRGHEMQKLDELVAGLANLGQEALAKYLNIGEYIKRRGTNLGIDMDGLIKSDAEIQQETQQQQAMQMATSGAATAAVNQGAQMMQGE